MKGKKKNERQKQINKGYMQNEINEKHKDRYE
jgi:hypothetical protein